MEIDGVPYRTIWPTEAGLVEILDQTRFPHEFEIVTLETLADAAVAIKDMLVRGAPLIGATAAYGIALDARRDPSEDAIRAAADRLAQTRPTAINLRWALNRMLSHILPMAEGQRAAAAWSEAAVICDEDVLVNSAIGDHALPLLETIAADKGRVNVLTHCNAGWLATVDWGTATAPIYKAFNKGIDVHVWVDETRPRNQGAHLTAWELGRHGVNHTLITDNAGGHLMQRGDVDIVIVGTDRTTAHGDVCNKIGTYLKALAARDNDVPFYVTLPTSTIDRDIGDGMDIPIEARSGEEVTWLSGKTSDGQVTRVQISPDGTQGGNPAFDVTPARLVTGLVTEKGIVEASAAGIASLF